MDQVTKGSAWRFVLQTQDTSGNAQAPDAAIEVGDLRGYVNGVSTALSISLSTLADIVGGHLIAVTTSALNAGDHVRIQVPFTLDAVDYESRFECMIEDVVAAINADATQTTARTNAATAAIQAAAAANYAADAETSAGIAVTQTTASALRAAHGLNSANLDTQLSSIAADAEALRKKFVRWTGTVSSVVIPGQTYGVTLTSGADTTIGTYTDHDCFVHDSNGKFKSGPHAMSNSASEGLVAVSASLQVGDRLTVARKVPTIVEINSSTTGTNAATAATEIGKVPRSATAVAAGASVRRTKDAATVSTLDETIGPVP